MAISAKTDVLKLLQGGIFVIFAAVTLRFVKVVLMILSRYYLDMPHYELSISIRRPAGKPRISRYQVQCTPVIF